MKKQSLICILSIILTAGIFALEVDKNELQSAESTTIEFINYTGPHKVIDSAASIKGIGSNLGKTIAQDVEKASSSGAANRYKVIHAVDPNETGKLDADILYIGSDATVDHIDNLRRIIAGYLSAAYSYSDEDANTLAVFITVYNAVYRGNLDAYKNKYKNEVQKNLSADNCGLSVNYKDWPGKSEIVIPLYDVANGGLSTVDTSVISDSKVIDSMKEDDDRNVESRKEMVDIKEREADNASEKAQEAQKEAVVEQKKANEAKKEATEAKKEAEEARKEAEEKQKVADENPEDQKAQEEAAAAKEEAEEKEEVAQQKEEAAQEAQESAEQAKEEAKEQQAQADKKQSEAQEERKEIAQDQKEVQKEEAEKAQMPTEYGIILADEAEMLSRLVKFNKDNGEIIQNSPVSVIRNRTIYKGSEAYFAIAGENSKNGAIKFVSIDPDTMEITGETDLAVTQDSVLVQDGADYLCVVEENGMNYLAKFGEDLSLKAKSEIQVKSATPITVTDAGFVVTDSNGKLKLLDKTDLSDLSKTNDAK
ncbi:MAG: hypothetical protein K6C97_06690 [Treponema sp.]|nr:hypothetical protein [Treponema sp.]